MNIISSDFFKKRFNIAMQDAHLLLNQSDFYCRYIKGHRYSPSFGIEARKSEIEFLAEGDGLRPKYNSDWIAVYHEYTKFAEDDGSDIIITATNIFIFKMTEQEIKKYLAFV